MKKPDISVAIPTYNRDEVLIDTIHDVLKQSHKNLELLVIDQTLKHKPETEKMLTKNIYAITNLTKLIKR